MVNTTGELGSHPLLAALRERLNLTPAWRDELARRAATLPEKSGIRCTPTVG